MTLCKMAYLQDDGGTVPNSSKKGRVIILGGGISGLMAANAVEDCFNEILMIERDNLTTTAPEDYFRKYVPQARHAHILLAAGRKALDELVPGFTQEAIKQGAVLTDATKNWRSLFPQGWLPVYQSNVHFLCLSRGLLETSIRKLTLRKVKHLQLMDQTIIEDIVLHKNGIHEVSVQNGNSSTTISCDYLIDARGRSANASKMLGKYGVQTNSRYIKPYLGYSSVWLRDNIQMQQDVNGLIVMAKPPVQPTGAVLFNIEQGKSILTFFGLNKHYPPKDWPGLIQFSQNLRSDKIYQTIKSIPEEKIYSYRKDESYFHDFGLNANWINNYLVVGDAISSFNPIYGQGITTSALSLLALKKHIGNNEDSRSLQRKLVEIYRNAWTISGNEDLRWPDTEADKKPLAISTMHKISDKIERAAVNSQDVSLAYIKVLHMLEPPLSIFHPWLLLKIMTNKKANHTYA